MDGVRLRPVRRDPEGVLLAADHPLAGLRTVGLRAVADHTHGWFARRPGR
jgi:hypothetical protein